MGTRIGKSQLMLSVPDQWQGRKEVSGIVFFGQALEQMFYNFTDSSYKVPTLNSLTRLQEADNVCQNIKEKRVHSSNIYPILEELEWSLKHDIVVNHILSEDLDVIISNIRDHDNLENVYQTVKFAERQIKDLYLDCTRNLLKGEIADGKKKSRIFQLSQIYATELKEKIQSQIYILHG